MNNNHPSEDRSSPATGEPESPSEMSVDPRKAFEMGAEDPTVVSPLANWSPPEAASIAPLFPDYTITELLGRGGMGAVYKGLQKSLDRPVAIKVLPPELADTDPSFATRFKHEAKSMARLDHPNIVQVHDFGQTEAGHWYIVMEFIDGMDFHQLIRSGELDVPQALNAVSRICDALEYAHGMGYVHRDIKPENIFINRKGVLKVGDFGLAKMIEGEDPANQQPAPGVTLTGMSVGTPTYCAPEQIDGQPTDHRADIYSLGVMFYEMLTKELPRGNFPPPSRKAGVDVRIDDVVLRAMESERERRYSSASEMRADVDALRTSTTTASSKPNKETNRQMTTLTNTTMLPNSTTDPKIASARTCGLIAVSSIILGLLILAITGAAAGSEGILKAAYVLEVLLFVAFIFGVVGWRHPSGKGALLASLFLGFVNVVFILSYGFAKAKGYSVEDFSLTHKLYITPRPSIMRADANKQKITVDESTLELKDGELWFNGKNHGPLQPYSKLVLDHGILSIKALDEK